MTTPTFASEKARLDAINQTLGTERLQRSPLARCIAPMLLALDWFGAPRRLIKSLPATEVIGIDDLGRMLVEQGFRMRVEIWRDRRALGGSGFDMLPIGTVVLSENGAGVYLGRLNGTDWWHDGSSVTDTMDVGAEDAVLLIEKNADFQPLDAPQWGWLNGLFFRARREIGGILAVSFVANILALVISLFTMFVYNTVIPSGAASTLWAMSVGAVIAIVGAWGLRLARVALISRLTAWAGNEISDIAMGKTMGLPMDVSTRLGVENNLIRLRSIEGVRQWFGGAGGVISADYPFVLIFLIVIAIIGGWIVVVPVIGVLLFALVSRPLAHFVQARSAEVGRVSRRLNEVTAVISQRLRALRGVRGSALWETRLAELVAQSVAANRNVAAANAFVQTVGQALTSLTVLATMAVGIALVLAGDMNTGGLIATMMLIWRITTPAQRMFSGQVRLKQLADSSKQLERLLATSGEASNPQITSPVSSLLPSIQADRVYYRYSTDREPALSGVSFDIEPGQVVAIVGPNGAGKTTLLEILSGARLPQNGRVLVGGRDFRQFDPADYRAWHGYVPQLTPGVPISLPQSMRLRRPESTDAELEAALQRVAGNEWWRFFGVESAADAFNVSISPSREDRDALRGRAIVRLAAAILGDPMLILLDDPLGDRDPALDPFFIQLIGALRGKSTVIIATHRPDLIQSADMIAVLDDGALAHFGPVTQAPPAAAQ